MEKIRALVVDDSPEIRKLVAEQVLKPHSFKVELASDGAEGLRKAVANPPDLILLDFEMPKLTGLEVLRELEKRKHRAPVILMISHRSEQIAVEIFNPGVHQYLMKPFSVDEAWSAIEDALFVTQLERAKEDLSGQINVLNEQLEQYIDNLNALYYISKSITTMVSPAKLLERLVDTVLFVTRSEECVLILIDPKAGRTTRKLRKRRPVEPRLTEDYSQPIADWLTADGTDEDSVKGDQPEAVLSVPLQIGQHVVGTLSISKQLSGQFTWQDDRLLRILADYGAIIIYNMQLQQQVQRTREHQH